MKTGYFFKRLNLLFLFVIVSLLFSWIIIRAKEENVNKGILLEIQDYTNDLFGINRIEAIEFMYNFDESSDYIYLKFGDGG